MPTSNGLVTSRDIRQNSVKALHLIDGAVETAKIPDLAVTFPDKIDNPIWVFAFGTFSADNAALTTTRTAVISESVDVPAWVDAVAVLQISVLQATNTSGGDQSFIVAGKIDGVGGAGTSNEVNSPSTQSHVDVTVVNTIGVAGASILIEVEAFLAGGTNSENMITSYGMIVGHR